MGVHGANTIKPGGITPPSQHARARRPRYKRLVFWVQVLLVLAIVFGAWLSLRNAVQEPVMAAPSHIGDLKRVRVVTGEEAIRQMQGIHTGDIGIIDGYKADYQNVGEKMTLWVGLASTEPEAEQLLERMVSAIAKPGMPFSAPAQMSVAGQQVFSTSGGGTLNYFFQDAHSVVWVMLTNSPVPSSRLTDVLKTVKFE